MNYCETITSSQNGNSVLGKRGILLLHCSTTLSCCLTGLVF